MDYSGNFTAKMKESGLTLEDAERLKFGDLSAEQAKALHPSFKSLPSLRIPYFNPDGTPLKDRPKFQDCPDYYRIRTLAKRSGFYKIVDAKNSYRQEPGTLPAVYYPQNFDKIPWLQIIEDAKVPIVLTEGELKAAKACKEGYPTIGIAGVHNFHARKHGYDLVPSLACINFVRRKVYICYDSDYRTKPQVVGGLKDLSETLQRYGATTYFVSLPCELGDKKTGLDDFFVAHGSENGSKIFNTLLEEAAPISTTEALFRLNDRYCYVTHPSCIVDCKLQLMLKKDHFKDAVQNIYYMAPQIKKDGEIKYKPAPVANAWMSWPLRNQADIIVYEPGQEQTVTIVKKDTEIVGYNTWKGWGCIPVEGDASHFTSLIDYMFSNTTADHKHWFMQWLAYPLQNPGHKMLTAVVLQSVLQGTGKTAIGYTMKEIYGDNFQEIDQAHIEDKFNEWAVDKSFILADEITGSKQRVFSNRLKSLITRREVALNRKNFNLYNITDHMNYLFTSNHPDAFYLEDSDRRFFIMTLPDYLLPKSFFREYDRKYFFGGNEISYIFHYLLNYDLTGFDPSGHAPRTQAKENMTQLGLSDLGLFIRNLTSSPESYAEDCCDLMSSKDILDMYKESEDVSPNSKRSITINGISRELNASNIPKVNHGKPIYLQKKGCRYYIVKNKEKWLAASHSDISEYMIGFSTTNKKKEKFE